MDGMKDWFLGVVQLKEEKCEKETLNLPTSDVLVFDGGVGTLTGLLSNDTVMHTLIQRASYRKMPKSYSYTED